MSIKLNKICDGIVLVLILLINVDVESFTTNNIRKNKYYSYQRQTTQLEVTPYFLKGNVCVVTGASRGIGKAIAIELGRTGATVYVTGTSTTSSNISETASEYVTNEEVGGEGTIEETATKINQVGGVGIPVYCDHSDDVQVKSLFEQVDQECGRLDLLVNNAFRVPAGLSGLLDGKFWEQGSKPWDAMHTVGLRSAYISSCYAAPIMLKTKPLPNKLPRPMIAMISSFGGVTYTFNVAYGVGKAALDRLAKDMASELKSYDVVVTSFWPGMVMTERMAKTVQSGDWEKQVGLPVDQCETPAYTGRAILALANDPNNMEKTGSVQIVAELAKQYGFVDENNMQPPSIRSLKFLLPAYVLSNELKKNIPQWLIPDWKLPIWIMANGRPDDAKKV